jgi:nicotinamidase-related amidase
MTGVQANICVLFTANDAYMRDYTLVVPSDCVASADPAEAEHALKEMEVVLKAQVMPSSELDLEALIARAGEPAPARDARRWTAQPLP